MYAIFMLLILLTGVVIGVINGICLYKINRAYEMAERKSQSVSGTIYELFQPNSEGVSPFSEVVNSVAVVMSEHIGKTVQASIRGSIGGSMKGLNAGLEQIAVEDNSTAAAMSALPKSLKKNPVAMMGLKVLMDRLNNNSPPGQISSSNGSVKQAKFNL